MLKDRHDSNASMTDDEGFVITPPFTVKVSASVRKTAAACRFIANLGPSPRASDGTSSFEIGTLDGLQTDNRHVRVYTLT